MKLNELEAEALSLVEKADEHREFGGDDKRNLVAKELAPKLAKLLPPPWGGLVATFGGPVLETVAHFIAHFVRAKGKAQKALEAEQEAHAATKKALAACQKAAKKAAPEPESKAPESKAPAPKTVKPAKE